MQEDATRKRETILEWCSLVRQQILKFSFKQDFSIFSYWSCGTLLLSRTCDFMETLIRHLRLYFGYGLEMVALYFCDCVISTLTM